MNKQTILSLTALGALLAGCTTAVIPYAGQSTALINNQQIPNPFPSLFPSPTPDAQITPLPSVEPGTLAILDVQPRTLRAGDTVTVRGSALNRIGTGEVSLVWDLPDRMLPVTILERTDSTLSLSFPNFPATLTQVSLHLRDGNRILQGYVLRIQDGGATGTPLPSLPPIPSDSPSPGDSPSPSPSPDVSPSGSPSAMPSGSVSPAASTSPGSTPEPVVSASASATPAPVVSASVSPSASPSPVVSASPAATAQP